MAITFPSTPNTGDIFTSNGRSWQWDGTAWTGYGNLPDPSVFAVDSTNNRVGIGTTSPTQILDIQDAANAEINLNDSGGTVGTSTNAKLQFQADSTNTGHVGFNNTSSGVMTITQENGPLWVNNKSANNILLRTSDNTRMTIDSSGNVGIGTTSPSVDLQIGETGRGTNAYLNLVSDAGRIATLRASDAGNFCWVGSESNHSFSIGANGTRHVIVDTSGNIGIGTNAPGSDLHIQKDATELRLENTTTNSSPVIKMYGKRGSGTQIISEINSRSSGSLSIDVDTGDSDGDSSSFFKVSVDGTDCFQVGSDSRVSISNITGTTADMSENLNVFGTSNPSMKVVTADNSGSSADFYIGGARTGSTTYLGRITFQNLANQSTGGNYNTARIESHDPDANSANGKGVLVFDTANGGTLSEAMRIDENGNVGIGKTSPSTTLDVAGEIHSNNFIIAGKGSGGVALTNNDGQGNANVTFNHVDGTPEQSGNAARIVVNTDTSSNASMSFEVRSGVTGGVNVGTTLSFRIYETSVDVVGALSKGSGSFKIPHPILEGTHNLVHSFIEGPRADLIYRGKATLVDGQATVNIDESAGMTEGTFVALNRDIQCWITNDSGWTAVRGSVSENILTIEAQDASCTDSVSWLVIGERHDQHMYDTGWTDDEGRVIVEPEIVVEETN